VSKENYLIIGAAVVDNVGSEGTGTALRGVRGVRGALLARHIQCLLVKGFGCCAVLD
jgi:hypothetical protein